MAQRLFAHFLRFGLALMASFFVFALLSPARSFPPLQIHPLPPTLARWQDPDHCGDYFEAVLASPVGALVWSRFPVTVYIPIERPSWVGLARTAIESWRAYLPIQEVQQSELADILILRQFPPSDASFNAETGKLEIPRVRSAITEYETFVKENILRHRMTIKISPNLNEASTLSAILHEMGHALGIWGHSPLKTDVMYFSQTRDLPSISVRDVNTLKKVYEQATRLGWEMESGK
jgi:predicted Zn-dependent protease